MLRPERASTKMQERGPAHAAEKPVRDTSKPEPIVPERSIAGTALMLVIAIMGCLACLSVGAVTLVDRAASNWSADIGRELTIEVSAVDPATMDQRLDRAADLARVSPGIGSVSIVSEQETRALLEPWLGILGSEAALAELPIPRLVAMTVTDTSLLNLTTLQAALDQEVPGATVDDHRVWTDQLARMAGAMVLGGLGVLILVLSATILCVIFATRAAMAGNKDVVEVLHFVGASHTFIAGQFQRHFLMLGMRGGLIGGVSAILIFLIFQLWVMARRGAADAAQVEALIGSPALGLYGYAGCALVVFLIAFLTAATSRITVSRFLRGR
ncbi:ABC transporter permease [Ahrensia marina]|uniref:cell division protein FtsX n=1 Tax=Ahrensia marina TaxID=1514904 RepID=UPI0035D0E170